MILTQGVATHQNKTRIFTCARCEPYFFGVKRTLSLQECYKKMHKMFSDKFPFRRSIVGGDSQTQLTEEQRRDRHRSIQLHMQLLQHASGCRNQQCPSANCNKMKVRQRQTFILLDRSSQNLLKHGANCSTRVQGGCAICRRIWALLQIHARQCRREACVVPKCRQLKEQLRALAQQQAQMDERRRAAMNAAYRRYQMNPNHTL